MAKNNHILIRNIYYMLAYAFQVLKHDNYKDVAKEDFDNIESLFAEILLHGVTQLLKQGLYCEYISTTEDLQTLRGKLNMPQTISNRSQHKNKISCEIDNFSINNIYNQIIKTTLLYLLAHKNVKKEQKNNLKRVILSFNEIDIIEYKHIHWSSLRYHRNNQTYIMLLTLCKFLIQKHLLTEQEGIHHLQAYTDSSMHHLFEKFVLAYYQKHYPELNAKSEAIEWDIAEDCIGTEMLPNMQSDIMLHGKNEILIIDTKYYARIFQTQYNKQTFHSNNLYQIFSYVMNKSVKTNKRTIGILLYAQTDDEIVPDNQVYISGHLFRVRTLNLNTDFDSIKKQLDKIVIETAMTYEEETTIKLKAIAL